MLIPINLAYTMSDPVIEILLIGIKLNQQSLIFGIQMSLQVGLPNLKSYLARID